MEGTVSESSSKDHTGLIRIYVGLHGAARQLIVFKTGQAIAVETQLRDLARVNNLRAVLLRAIQKLLRCTDRIHMTVERVKGCGINRAKAQVGGQFGQVVRGYHAGRVASPIELRHAGFQFLSFREVLGPMNRASPGDVELDLSVQRLVGGNAFESQCSIMRIISERIYPGERLTLCSCRRADFSNKVTCAPDFARCIVIEAPTTTQSYHCS